MPDRIRAFISYARKDGEDFSSWLINELKGEVTNIKTDKDHFFMEGGKDYWEQIVNKIDKAQFLILAMTSGAIQSKNVWKEWYYARDKGKCVYPVMKKQFIKDKKKLPFKELPQCLQRAHCYNLDKEWGTFIKHLKSPCREVKVLYPEAEELEDKLIERSKKISLLFKCLLDAKKVNSLCTTTALYGAGGFGKTTLAKIFCLNVMVKHTNN